jgi:hypothetical protein
MFSEASSYNYDRRTAASGTPVLDKLIQDHSKNTSVIDIAIKKIHAIADKVDKMVRLNDEDSNIPGLAHQAVESAHKMFDPFRSFLTSWKGEVEKVGESPIFHDIVREIKNLAAQLKEMDRAYAYSMEASSASSRDGHQAAKALHDLAIAVSSVKTVYGQYMKTYLGFSPRNVYTITDEAGGMQSRVYAAKPNEFRVFLIDLDSGNQLPQWTSYPDFDRAIAYAKKLVGAAPGAHLVEDYNP